MEDRQPKLDSQETTRRELMRKGAKVAYVAPAVLAAVKATERPAYAQGTGAPVAAPPP